jgi:hypothetical protein
MTPGARTTWAAWALSLLAACGPGPAETAPWDLSPTGVGGISFGAAVADVREELGIPVESALLESSCEFVSPEAAPDGLTLMAESGRIVRADVTSGTARTAEGAAIGDSEARIMELYPALRRMPHKYTTGSYLVVLPNAPADTLHRYVFETDGSTVTRFRAGLYPPVEYVEGCG